MDYLYGSLCAHVKQNDYVLPVASKTVLGGVKIDGETITIDQNGVISAQSSSSLTPGDGIEINSGTIEISDVVNKQVNFQDGISIGRNSDGLIHEDNSNNLIISTENNLLVVSNNDLTLNSINGNIISEKKIKVPQIEVTEAIDNKLSIYTGVNQSTYNKFSVIRGTGKLLLQFDNGVSINNRDLQTKLTAGTGIDITNDVISCTSEGKVYSSGNGITVDNTLNTISSKVDSSTIGFDASGNLKVIANYAPIEQPNFLGDIEIYSNKSSYEQAQQSEEDLRATSHTKIEDNHILLTNGNASAHLRAGRIDNVNTLVLTGASDSGTIKISGITNPTGDNEAANKNYVDLENQKVLTAAQNYTNASITLNGEGYIDLTNEYEDVSEDYNYNPLSYIERLDQNNKLVTGTGKYLIRYYPDGDTGDSLAVSYFTVYNSDDVGNMATIDYINFYADLYTHNNIHYNGNRQFVTTFEIDSDNQSIDMGTIHEISFNDRYGVIYGLYDLTDNDDGYKAANKNYVDSKIRLKQDILNAGNNITISDNTISATVPEVPETVDFVSLGENRPVSSNAVFGELNSELADISTVLSLLLGEEEEEEPEPEQEP